MTTTNDRVEALVEGAKRHRRPLVSPEGVPLDIMAAGVGERLVAFAIDLALLYGSVYFLYLIVTTFLSLDHDASVGATFFLFAVFVVRTCYFLHFELAWQGRTPGKKICGLRVINRAGGELTPSAVIARNLTREVEFFLPASLFFNLEPGAGAWQQVTLFGWILAIASLPLWGKDRLRAGDLIGGTQVIAMPKRVLLADLAGARLSATEAAPFVFNSDQLAIYGAFELQVLEEFLRRPDTPETRKLLEEVCGKIRRKIGWQDEVRPDRVRRFLTDFYAAERADLERGKLFGRLREDKTAGGGGGAGKG